MNQIHLLVILLCAVNGKTYERWNNGYYKFQISTGSSTTNPTYLNLPPLELQPRSTFVDPSTSRPPPYPRNAKTERFEGPHSGNKDRSHNQVSIPPCADAEEVAKKSTISSMWTIPEPVGFPCFYYAQADKLQPLLKSAMTTAGKFGFGETGKVQKFDYLVMRKGQVRIWPSYIQANRALKDRGIADDAESFVQTDN